jgi:chromosome segregation ATPase
MPDPRIDELLTHLSELTAEGEPAPLALMAREVVSKLNAVSQARMKLDVYQAELERAEERAESLKVTLRERESLRNDIANIIVDANSRGSLSSTSQGAHFRNNAKSKSEGLSHFEDDYASALNQFNVTSRTLKAKRGQIAERQSEIARLSDAIGTLLEQSALLAGDGPAPSGPGAPARAVAPQHRTASRHLRRRVKVRRRSTRTA